MRTRRAIRDRRGFTLIEMTTSLAIASILLLAIGSAMVLAGKAIPAADNPASAMLSAAGVADRIGAELQFALDITERTSRSIAFTIPDRDADGKPETVRYSWSGSPGAPLTRQFNGATASNLIDSVHSLAFNCDTVQVAESYPGPAVEGPEQLLAGHMPATYTSAEKNIEDNNWVGQVFRPTLPATARSWRVTRVRFKAKKSATLQRIDVQLMSVGSGNVPTGTVIQNAVVDEPNSGSSVVVEAAYPSGAANLPGASLSIVLRKDATLLGAGGTAGIAEYAKTATGGYLDAVHDPGLLGIGASTTFTISNVDTLLYEVYGKVTTPGSRTVLRTRLSAVRLSMQTAADPGSRVDTAVALANKPESLDARWATDFSEDPTIADRNGDGSADWRSGTGFDTGQLSGGVWRADREIVSNPPNSLTGFTTVDVAFRDTTTGGSGAGVEMRVEATVLGHGIIEAYVAKQADGTQTLTVQTRDLLLLPAVLTTVRNLPDRMVNLHLHVNPAADSVGVTVNGIAIGSFTYNRSVDLSDGFVRAFNTFLEGGAEFDSVRVRVGGSP